MGFLISSFLKFTLQLNETYSVGAVHEVSSEGTYYVCVVAYNRALEPSKPVCSDGVTVTTAIPKVKEVAISGAFVKGGLVTDNFKSSVWVLEDTRVRKLIDNPTKNCVYVFNFVMLCNLFVFMALSLYYFLFFQTMITFNTIFKTYLVASSNILWKFNDKD